MNRLPHLYPTEEEEPAHLCIHRGSLDEWFAEHDIVELVHRARAWLRDAARNRLTRGDDGFEPTRILNPTGYIVYDPNEIRHITQEQWSEHLNTARYGLVIYELLARRRDNVFSGREPFAVQLVQPCSDELARQVYATDRNENRYVLGILTWPAKTNVCADYFGSLPKTLGELSRWAGGLGTYLEKALKKIVKLSQHRDQLLLPVTIVVPRPREVLGSSSNLELINLVLRGHKRLEPSGQQLDLHSPVHPLVHRLPFTNPLARNVSGFEHGEELGAIVLLGCGAVGSKVALHLAKSGVDTMTLVDSDQISPHNLVRHGLLAESLGMNKAEAVKGAIVGLYGTQKAARIVAMNISALELLTGSHHAVLDQHTWLIDATASSMVLNALSQTVLPSGLRCCRCEIAAQGRLGFLYVEGSDRNPRLDDLQVAVFDMALEDIALSRWLKAHAQSISNDVSGVMEEITVGVSCSSETMRLSDDLVSLHSAAFTTRFRRTVKWVKAASSGHIQISSYDPEGDVTAVVRTYAIDSFEVVRAVGLPEWEIRFKAGLTKELQKMLELASPNETGGLLVGAVNMKWQQIHVVRVLPAPKDSKSCPYAFVRGVTDVPQIIQSISERTGGMLSYVGEWHSHPAGGSEMSAQDLATVKKIKRHLDKIRLPTYILIVTPNGLHPYVSPP